MLCKNICIAVFIGIELFIFLWFAFLFVESDLPIGGVLLLGMASLLKMDDIST